MVDKQLDQPQRSNYSHRKVYIELHSWLTELVGTCRLGKAQLAMLLLQRSNRWVIEHHLVGWVEEYHHLQDVGSLNHQCKESQPHKVHKTGLSYHWPIDQEGKAHMNRGVQREARQIVSSYQVHIAMEVMIAVDSRCQVGYKAQDQQWCHYRSIQQGMMSEQTHQRERRIQVGQGVVTKMRWGSSNQPSRALAALCQWCHCSSNEMDKGHSQQQIWRQEKPCRYQQGME